MKAIASFILTLLTVAAYSQTTLNSYKYVIVPERFEFSKMDNQYGLNTTTKSLLEQKGFTALWTNGELPPAVAANKCNALRAELTQKNGLFTTALTLTLKDCQGNIVWKSKEGKSREKEFEAAYGEALKNAVASLTDYKYDSTASLASAPTQQAYIPAVSVAVPVNSSSTSPATTQPQQPTTQPQQSAPVPAPAPAKSTAAEITGILYAQTIPNGYQLIDTSPKKVLTLLKTSVDDYFIAEGGPSNGVVFKKNGEWFFEYYKDSKLVSQKLEVKF